MAALGVPVVLIEASDRVGGLAGGIEIGGDIYEYGPHVFHTTDERVLRDIKELLGHDLLPYRRTIQIKFLGNFFKFPLSIPDVFQKLPFTTVVHAVLSFGFHFVKGFFIRPAVENSETVLRRYYGDVLYRLFFRDYIERVWGVPRRVSPRVRARAHPALRPARPSREGVRGAALARRAAPAPVAGYVEKVEGELWTTRRGFSLICEKMADDFKAKGGTLRLATKAKAIRHDGMNVTSVEVETGEERKRFPARDSSTRWPSTTRSR
ncbi:MAG: FAD-dependent oxidoreductase [Elusimicrobiota bacterium]|nr:MAG: FAD-dependent oxidoreductase [Elusimicrobiota bacterium]